MWRPGAAVKLKAVVTSEEYMAVRRILHLSSLTGYTFSQDSWPVVLREPRAPVGSDYLLKHPQNFY